jgi:hypothetical protein
MVAGLVALGFVAAFLIQYIESGADDGTVTLRVAESYGERTFEYIGEENFYLVRQTGGAFVALSDLDAANQLAEGRRCRAVQVRDGDPRFRALDDRYGTRLSAEARGWRIFLQESCNAAVYDISGMRLDGEGPNLERLAVTFDERGFVVVDTRDRTCTERLGPREFVVSSCP